MNVIVCIGGSGTRCFEATNYLTAANLLNKGTYNVIIIDKDTTNGGTDQTQKNINSYTAMREKLSKGINDNDINLCKSYINREVWDFDAVLRSINRDDVVTNRTLANTIVSRANLVDDGILLDLIYSKHEQNTNLDRGFYGHPSIGAALFKYVTQRTAMANPENQVFVSIENGINAGSEELNIFIIGSIFGGTGASIFPNIAKLFRDMVGTRPVKLRIGGVLLLPYFSVPDIAVGEKMENITNITANEFLMKTKIALEQYDDWKVIRDDNSIFDSLYLIGNTPYNRTSAVNANGGPQQINHFHIVDFFAGNALCHFFNNPDANDLFVAQLSDAEFERASWENLPNSQVTKNNMFQLARFASFVALSLYPQFILLKDKKRIPALCQTYGSGFLGNTKANNTQIDDFQITLVAIYSYCVQYLKFIYDISLNGKDWSIQGMNADNGNLDCQLFSSSFLFEILAKCTKIATDKADLKIDNFDNLHTLNKLKIDGDNEDVVKIIDELLESDKIVGGSANPAVYFNKLFEYCSIREV